MDYLCDKFYDCSFICFLVIVRTDTETDRIIRAGFCWWGPGANIEDVSSLIIHWSSGSHKRSTNWANQYDIYLVGGPGPWPPGLLKSGPENHTHTHRQTRMNALLTRLK